MDKIIKVKDSLIQHGKYNDRVYLMKIDKKAHEEVIEFIEKLAVENGYGKIFAKVPFSLKDNLKLKGFVQEAVIPSFFDGTEDCLFLSKYLDQYREKDMEKNGNEKIIDLAMAKAKENKEDSTSRYQVIKATEENASDIVELFKIIFETYPFPIFEKKYIIQTMNTNIDYYCIYDDAKLVAVSSSEKDEKNKNAEMTDFAVKEDYRGKNLSALLLRKMEKDRAKDGYSLLYTIARSRNAGVNITFAREGYSFSGRLVNNTNISGNIESMNVWYKRI